MNWAVEFSKSAEKELRKLQKPDQKKIISYLKSRIQTAENPRQFGKGLLGSFSGLWRYRVSDFRIICQIEDEKLTILVIQIGNRKEVYR